MIKAKTDNVIILGLSDENMQRLKQGQPIKFDMTNLGVPGVTMFIFNGKDEQAMTESLKDFIGDKTKFFDYMKLPKEKPSN